MNTLIEILPDLLVPAIVIAGTMLFITKLPKFKKLHQVFKSNKFLIIFLLVWTAIGFFTQEDFTERCGCLVFSRGLFSLDYIIFSSISLSIFALSLFFKSNKTLLTLLFVELFYWLFKLLFIKSGYIGGLFAIRIFGYYDYIGLTARLLLINGLLNSKLKQIYMPLLAGLVIMFKLFVLPCQENFVYRDFIKPISEKRLLERLNGTWEGELYYTKDTSIYQPFDGTELGKIIARLDTTTYKDTTITKTVCGVLLSFNDSTLIIAEQVPKYAGKYTVDFLAPYYKHLYYLPSKYSNLPDNDSIYQYRLPIEIEELTDSNMTVNIKEFRLTLNKNRCSGFQIKKSQIIKNK